MINTKNQALLKFLVITGLGVTPWLLEAKTKAILHKSPRQIFSHKIHKTIMSQHNITCMSCHVFNVNTATKKGEKAQDFSAQLLSEVGRNSCHLCHNNPQQKTPVNAPSRCNLCHALTPTIKPMDHTPDWKLLHGSSAKADSQRCTTCHKTNECQTCHSPSPSQIPLRRMHVGNFQLNHSILARVNPQKCSTCHSPNYCLRCHQGSK